MGTYTHPHFFTKPNMSEFNYNWKLSDLEKVKPNGKTVFSCFACGGGSSMGYKLAGYDVIGFNEIDQNLARCYIKNLKPKFRFIEDIRTLVERNDLPDELYSLDILDGSPPCSSFTGLGNREKDWGKEKKFTEGQKLQVLDTLFFDFINLAKKLQPKMVVSENVPGLLQGNAKKYLTKIYNSFIEAEYFITTYLLDSSVMGVPQKRERVFLIALRKDLLTGFTIPSGLIDETLNLNLVFNEKPILFKEIKSNDEVRQPLIQCRIKHFYSAKNGYGSYATKTNAHFGYYSKCYNELVCPVLVSDSGQTYSIEETPHYVLDSEFIKAGTFPSDYNFRNVKPIKLIGLSVPPVMMANISKRIYDQILSKL